MRIFIFSLLIFISGSLLGQTDQNLAFSFYRGEKNLFFSSQDAEKVIQFKITGLQASELDVFKQKVLNFDGVINFSIENAAQPGEYFGKAIFDPSTDHDFFVDFFTAMGITKINVEDTEMLPSELFSFSSQQFKELEKLNYQINQIEFKIDWVWEHEKEQATQNGWFDDAYNNLQLAKEAKSNYINSLNK